MNGFADKKLICNAFTARRKGDAGFCAVPKAAFFKERT